MKPGANVLKPEVMKHISCSTWLGIKIAKTNNIFRFKSLKSIISLLINVKIPTFNFWQFNIFEQDIFHAQHEKSFITLGELNLSKNIVTDWLQVLPIKSFPASTVC